MSNVIWTQYRDMVCCALRDVETGVVLRLGRSFAVLGEAAGEVGDTYWLQHESSPFHYGGIDELEWLEPHVLRISASPEAQELLALTTPLIYDLGAGSAQVARERLPQVLDGTAVTLSPDSDDVAMHETDEQFDVGWVSDLDDNFKALVFQSEELGLLEIQREYVPFDEFSDTPPCVVVDAGPTAYGGLESWTIDDGSLLLTFDHESAKALGIDDQVTLPLSPVGQALVRENMPSLVTLR